MSNIKNVSIQLNTTIDNGEDKETYELLTSGTLQNKGGTLYLRYDEVQQDMEKVHTILKWAPEEAFIMRSGIVKMRQKFVKELMTVGSYESPYVTMQMLTTTQEMNHSRNEGLTEGKMVLHYHLNMNGNDVGQYKMEIYYKEENSK